MRRLGFPAALVAALVAHGGAIAAVHGVPLATPARGAPFRGELTIEPALVEVTPIEPYARRPRAEQAGPDGPVASPVAARALRKVARDVPVEGDHAPGPATAPSADATEGSWSLPSAPVELGLGLRASGMASRATALAAREAHDGAARADAPVDLQRMLTDPLRERDAALGLRTSGPLVGAVRDAVRASFAIEPSEATLEVDVGEGGQVLSTRVVSSTREPLAWAGIAREVTASMAQRRLRVPPGARGMRASLRVVVTPNVPEGATTAPGAVPDDAPGGSKACEGTGLARRCVAGMPLGLSVTGGEIASAARRVLHKVRVEILGERPVH